ncbi:MAG: chorismate mutase [Candidatus Cloacimonetes bacterium]|nr:chorismate mutase [Candidatus Cloacimonadota bacterium]
MQSDIRLDTKRKEISELDTMLIQILLKRLSLCQDVAYIKMDLELPILNKGREDQILTQVMRQCEQDPHLKIYVSDILKQVMNASKRLQKEILSDQCEKFPNF